MKLRSKFPPHLTPIQSTSSKDHAKTSNSTMMNMNALMMTPSTSRNIPNITAYSTRRRSSTASGEFSPDSPGIGRIAKSNARLLNGVDLTVGKGNGGYLDTTIALPELKTFELNEKCPTIGKFLKSGEKLVSTDQLPAIQHELEELISRNLDYQQPIHGEITYLTTSEYPTGDLKNRPMPSYDTMPPDELKKLMERARRAETTTNPGIADLEIMSSPEDDETPHILDVPQRFWTWAKEYLHHISIENLRQFKEKMVDRFSEEVIIGKYCQEDTKFEQKSPKSPKFKGRVNTASRGQQIKRKHSPDNESPPRTPVKHAKLSNKASAGRRLSFESQKNSKRSPTKAKGAPNSNCSPIQNGKISGKSTHLNGIHIHPRLSNGIHTSKNTGKAQTNSTKTKSRAKGRRGNHGKLGIMETPKMPGLKEVKQEEQSSEDEEEDEEEMHNDDMEQNGEENGQEDKHKPGTSDQGENHGDQVTAVLCKKQARLRELFARTQPTINELYMRMLKEHAVHEVFRQMDEADNKLYQAGSKFDCLNNFNKEQRQEAKTALQEHQKIYAYFHGSTKKGRAGA